jgi:hypothetical protein
MRNAAYWEAQQTNGQEVFNSAYALPPSPGCHGFCAYGDAPPAIGGGMNAFYFFENYKAMADAIRTFGLFINLPRSDLDFEEIEALLSEIDINMQAARETIRRLNHVLRHATQFVWIGTFESLLNGEEEFELEIRKKFRIACGQEGIVAPIKSDEIKVFRIFLSEYGL